MRADRDGVAATAGPTDVAAYDVVVVVVVVVTAVATATSGAAAASVAPEPATAMAPVNSKAARPLVAPVTWRARRAGWGRRRWEALGILGWSMPA